MKRIHFLRILLIFFFLFAGANHFINPNFYFDQIPPYFNDKEFINYASGIIEIVLAFGLIFPRTRMLSSIGIILLMTAFIPTHWYVIEQKGCLPSAYCVPIWAAWLRLIILQPLFIYWAWVVRK